MRPISALMVEDNPDHAELMMDAFKEFHIHNDIFHVSDGVDAIAYLRHQAPYEDQTKHPRPDIIFMDIQMPRQGGIETLLIIKSDLDIRDIPVVMVTTSKTSAEIKECFSLGANGFITKPFQFEDFSQKMKELNYYWVLTSELPENPTA